MSVTRANWGATAIALPDVGGASPFEMPVEEIGQRIDLSDPADRLRTRLVELVRQEGRLDGTGVGCEIKGRPDTTCLACSLSEAGDGKSRLGMLCRIGREQEVVSTELVVVERQAKK